LHTCSKENLWCTEACCCLRQRAYTNVSLSFLIKFYFKITHSFSYLEIIILTSLISVFSIVITQIRRDGFNIDLNMLKCALKMNLCRVSKKMLKMFIKMFSRRNLIKTDWIKISVKMQTGGQPEAQGSSRLSQGTGFQVGDVSNPRKVVGHNVCVCVCLDVCQCYMCVC